MGEIALLNILEQSLNTHIGIITSELASLLVRERLGTADLLKVDLHIVEVAICVDELERVSRVSVHVVVTLRSTTVGEQNHNLVNGLGILAKVIPEHVGILEVSLRVTLLGVDEMRELGGVTDEEDGGVVEDPVEVALLSLDLDSEATGVTGGISRARLASDSGEADGDGSTLSDLVEKSSAGEVGDVVGDLNEAVSTGTLGVDDSL